MSQTRVTDARLARILAVIMLVCVACASLDAKGGTVHVKGYTTKSGHYVAPYERKAKADASPSLATQRRSSAVRAAFMRQTGYPHGRSGYVIDHIVPLACGGADAVSNLQWQSVADAKAKDAWERRGC